MTTIAAIAHRYKLTTLLAALLIVLLHLSTYSFFLQLNKSTTLERAENLIEQEAVYVKVLDNQYESGLFVQYSNSTTSNDGERGRQTYIFRIPVDYYREKLQAEIVQLGDSSSASLIEKANCLDEAIEKNKERAGEGKIVIQGCNPVSINFYIMNGLIDGVAEIDRPGDDIEPDQLWLRRGKVMDSNAHEQPIYNYFSRDLDRWTTVETYWIKTEPNYDSDSIFGLYFPIESFLKQ